LGGWGLVKGRGDRAKEKRKVFGHWAEGKLQN
jgi:hypothetical protein